MCKENTTQICIPSAETKIIFLLNFVWNITLSLSMQIPPMLSAVPVNFFFFSKFTHGLSLKNYNLHVKRENLVHIFIILVKRKSFQKNNFRAKIILSSEMLYTKILLFDLYHIYLFQRSLRKIFGLPQKGARIIVLPVDRGMEEALA